MRWLPLCLIVVLVGLSLLVCNCENALRPQNQLQKESGREFTFHTISSFEIDPESNQNFLVNGKKAFLFGVSYFAATGNNDWQADIDDMLACGFNFIRIWAFWESPPNFCGECSPNEAPPPKTDISVINFVGPDRHLDVNETYMNRLVDIVEYCRDNGMIVDVTFFRTDNVIEFPYGPVTELEHQTAGSVLTDYLKDYPNVYFDVANEANVNKTEIGYSDLFDVIQIIKSIDGDRLCTASFCTSDDPAERAKLDLCQFAGLDFLSLHVSYYNSAEKLLYYFNQMEANENLRMPIHLNETARLGRFYDLAVYPAVYPEETHFYELCTGAKGTGAAGWILHNGHQKLARGKKCFCPPYRSFHMIDYGGHEMRLFAQFNLIPDQIERTVCDNVVDRAGGASWSIRRYQAEYPEQCDPGPANNRVGQLSPDSYSWDASGEGYVTGGPYDEVNGDYYLDDVPAGSHEVRWRIKISGSANQGDKVLTLGVYGQDAQTMLLKQPIFWEDIVETGEWQLFKYSFTSSGETSLRLCTYFWKPGTTSVSCDWVQLKIGG